MLKSKCAFFLIAFLVLAGTAVASESVDIRSTVMTFSEYGVNPATIDPTSWASLYYDFDKGQGTESFIIDVAGSDKINITYTTSPIFVEAEADSFGDFCLISFFAEEYVALANKDDKVFANKIAKLVIDDDYKYTLGTSHILDLGEGYTVIPKQIDVDNNKVWLELWYNGEIIDDAVINTDRINDVDKNWVLKQNVLNEDDIIVFKIHVNEVFQSPYGPLVEFQGIWLCDFENAIDIKNDTDCDRFMCEAADEYCIEYVAINVTLSKDSDINLGKGIRIVTGDKYDDNKQFTFVKEYIDEGIYEIRSSILPVRNGELAVDYTQFAAFYYDLDEDIATENMTLTITEGNKLRNASGIIYTTTAKMISYEDADISGTYPVVGLFGAAYVPLMNNNGRIAANKMAGLVIDDDEKYTVGIDQPLALGKGYVLIPKQIDADGSKVLIELRKDGKMIDDAIISTADISNNPKTWTLKQDVLNEEYVTVMNVHVNKVFRNSTGSFVEIQGIWLIDYINAFEIKKGDSFGKLDFDGADGNTLTFVSNNDITLTKNKEIDLGSIDDRTMKIRTNSPDWGVDTLFYIFIEKTLDGYEEPTAEPTPESAGIICDIDNIQIENRSVSIPVYIENADRVQGITAVLDNVSGAAGKLNFTGSQIPFSGSDKRINYYNADGFTTEDQISLFCVDLSGIRNGSDVSFDLDFKIISRGENCTDEYLDTNPIHVSFTAPGPSVYVISYSGGEVEADWLPDEDEAEEDTDYIVPIYRGSKSGYIFRGWNLDGKYIAPGDRIPGVKSDMELVAQWSPLEENFSPTLSDVVTLNRIIIYELDYVPKYDLHYDQELDIFDLVLMAQYVADN